ncbi:MAG: putative rane protein, partial [Thermoanaerobaculia bacterium]|nr:putative rane protein [Thermoanaerobaculia bacterium]
MSPRLFVVAALLLGLAYVFVTPPFEVPDEQNHFWRALAVGRGQLLPARGLDSMPVVKSTQDFVWVMSRGEPRETLQQKLRIVAAIRYDGTPAG